jgi:hypothetical protein
VFQIRQVEPFREVPELSVPPVVHEASRAVAESHEEINPPWWDVKLPPAAREYGWLGGHSEVDELPVVPAVGAVGRPLATLLGGERFTGVPAAESSLVDEVPPSAQLLGAHEFDDEQLAETIGDDDFESEPVRDDEFVESTDLFGFDSEPPVGHEIDDGLPEEALRDEARSETVLFTGIPAAENPQIFGLLKALERDRLRDEKLEVESRPERNYLRVWPGSSKADEIRLEYHGVANLQVATRTNGKIGTFGLGLMFPAHTVHARDSTAVVVGNNCELTQVEHVHVRQGEVGQDDALRSDRVKQIVARAEPGQDNSAVVDDLRAALNDLVERPADNGPDRAERRVRADCVTSIHRAESVQLGNDAMTRLDSRFVVERTTIPAGALLAESADLARRYVEIAADPADDPGALAAFLGDLVGAAQNADDDNVLGYADGLPKQQATLLGLFGLAAVNNATSIMVGTGNRLTTELDLTTAPLRLDDDIAHGVRKHRQDREDRRKPDPGDAA